MTDQSKQEESIPILPDLGSEKQYIFVKEYLIDLNATQAAIRAGYSEKSARQTGSDLLADPYISVHIVFHQKKKIEKLDIKHDDVLRELAGVGFAKMSDFVEMDTSEEIEKAVAELNPSDFDTIKEYRKELRKIKAGLRMKNLDEIGPSLSAITEISVSSIGIIDIKTKDKVKSLELIGKHIGMFKYEPESSGRNRESHVDRIRRSIQLTRRRAESRKSEPEAGSGGVD